MKLQPDNIAVLVVIAMLSTFSLGISFLLILYRSRMSLLREKQKAELAAVQHQEKLLQSIVESQEEERRRIGQDLHDDVGAALSALRLNIDHSLSGLPEKGQIESIRKNSKQMIDGIITSVRNISHRLTPEILNLYSLSEAVMQAALGLETPGVFSIRFNEENLDLLNVFDLNRSVSIYRVINELFNNTVKHAKANYAMLEITRNTSELVITYSDDGVGIQAQGNLKKGIGLKNIENRLALLGGSISLQNPVKGYSIVIRIPVLSTDGREQY
ncbi:MAG: histidine kinase [Bacteroidota bacterium]